MAGREEIWADRSVGSRRASRCGDGGMSMR
jgi:hypothetical protein